MGPNDSGTFLAMVAMENKRYVIFFSFRCNYFKSFSIIPIIIINYSYYFLRTLTCVSRLLISGLLYS